MFYIVLLSFCIVLPAAKAGTIDGKTVEISVENRHYSARLFEPDAGGPYPALVEIHGIYGVEKFDVEISEKLAASGYVTLQIDLYGRPAANYEDGLHLRDQLRPYLRQDLLAAANYLRDLKEVAPNRVGAIGWCMGGGFALQLAIADPKLAASVIYYGPVVVDSDQLHTVRAHLLGYFGREDRSISLPAVRMMDNALQEAGNPMELHIVPGARHGFAQPNYRGDEEAYMPDAAAEAWENALRFLSVNLAGKTDRIANQPKSRR